MTNEKPVRPQSSAPRFVGPLEENRTGAVSMGDENGNGNEKGAEEENADDGGSSCGDIKTAKGSEGD